MFERGAAMIRAKTTKHAGVPITYTRGDVSIHVTAIVGQTDTESADHDGVTVRSATRDYLIDAADLVFEGAPTEPRRGDQITQAGRTFEAQPIGGQPAARWSGRDHQRWRIHTREITRA